MGDQDASLNELLKLDSEARLRPLGELARTLSGTDDARIPDVAAACVELLASGVGAASARTLLGEALGHLGDPRLRLPSDDDYWVRVAGEPKPVILGRYPVTNWEYRAFVEAGGYDRAELWSDEGRAWLAGTDNPWPALAAADHARAYVVPNQPVVGVTRYEAEAYAAHHGARLPRWDERVWAVRGAARRPYPWGDPFGEGNANTKEEVLGRPCAVGLYLRDRTPDGICDLAGNVGEWTADMVGGEALLHPGAWDQPSMAAWAKALTTEKPRARWAGLGFRLARD